MISNDWRKKKILAMLPSHKTKIGVAVGLSKGVLFRLMEEMQYEDDSLHIDHWDKLENGCWVAIYVAGDGDDAPRPARAVRSSSKNMRHGRKHGPYFEPHRDPLDVAFFGHTGTGHTYKEGEPYAFAV